MSETNTKIQGMRLFGLLNPIDRFPSFLVPIFEEQETYYLQDLNEFGRIESFVECQIEGSRFAALARSTDLPSIETDTCGEPFVRLNDAVVLSPGDSPLFAYGVDAATLIVGSREEVVRRLKIHEKTIQKFRFAYLDYLEFSGRTADLENARKDAHQELAASFDLDFANDWLHYSYNDASVSSSIPLADGSRTQGSTSPSGSNSIRFRAKPNAAVFSHFTLGRLQAELKEPIQTSAKSTQIPSARTEVDGLPTGRGKSARKVFGDKREFVCYVQAKSRLKQKSVQTKDAKN